MKGINYNDVSYNDRQLENNINLALQEYDSLTQKISGKKGGINQYLNDAFQYKIPSGYTFTRNSPYISSKKKDYSFLTKFHGNYNGGKLFTSNVNNFGTNDLIEEFKQTLEKSQIIKDDLLKMNVNIDLRKKFKNKKYNYLNKNKINSSLKFHPFNKYEENIFEEEKSSTSNGGTTLEYISNVKNIFNENSKKNLSDKKRNKSLKKNELEKKKIESAEKELINKYQEIKKENRILELEISNYKKLANQYINFGQYFKNKFNNKYSQKIINELEQSLQQNIQNNCNIIDSIIKIRKNNEALSSKLKLLSDKMNINFKEIEKRNRKHAEIQMTNEENEQKIANLEDEKNSLLHESESQKITLLKLKNKENNLNLLCESNKKLLNDKEEHILKLKNTINQYQKFKNKNKKVQYSTNIDNDANIKVFDNNINNLKLEINKLISIKNKLLASNSNLQNQLFNSKSNNFENSNEIQLNNQLDFLKMENKQKMDNLKEKENQLEMLKNEIDFLTNSIKSDNQLDENKKMKINNLINEIESSNIINNLDEQNINEQIKKSSELNLQKNNEIAKMCKEYLKIETEKDKLINDLESKINQGYMNQTNHANQVKQESFNQKALCSINELTLNDDINNNIDQQLLNINPNINNNEINDMNDMNNYDEIPLLDDDGENLLNTNDVQNNFEGNYDINQLENVGEINNEKYLNMNQNNYIVNNQNEGEIYDLNNNINEDEQYQEQYGNEMTDIKELKEDDDMEEQEYNNDNNNENVEMQNENEEQENNMNDMINNNDNTQNVNNNLISNENQEINDLDAQAINSNNADKENENQDEQQNNEINELNEQENINEENNDLENNDNNIQDDNADINDLNGNEEELNDENMNEEGFEEEQYIDNPEQEGNENENIELEDDYHEELENNGDEEEMIENQEEENNNEEEVGEEEFQMNNEELEGDENENLENEEEYNNEENQNNDDNGEIEYNLDQQFNDNDNNINEEENIDGEEQEQEQEQLGDVYIDDENNKQN